MYLSLLLAITTIGINSYASYQKGSEEPPPYADTISRPTSTTTVVTNTSRSNKADASRPTATVTAPASRSSRADALRLPGENELMHAIRVSNSVERLGLNVPYYMGLTTENRRLILEHRNAKLVREALRYRLDPIYFINLELEKQLLVREAVRYRQRINAYLEMPEEERLAIKDRYNNQMNCCCSIQ